MATRQSLMAPILRRVWDRLAFHREDGVFLRNVQEIRLGFTPRKIPASLAPLALVVSAYPVRCAGGVRDAASGQTAYRGRVDVAVVNANVSEFDAMVGWLDTIDDVLKIVCEVEQKTQWGALTVPAAYGEAIALLFSDTVTVDYPKIPDLLASVAVVSWEIECRVSWET